MAKLEKENPNDRENSLYASVELSLRRLPPEVRAQVNKLAAFHDGGSLWTMSQVMEIETDGIGPIAQMLIAVGIAEEMPYSYLRLDPALPAFLKLGQSNDTLSDLAALWVDAMGQLVGFLYGQKFEDGAMAAQLTLLELPNLLVFLDSLLMKVKANQTMAESVSDTVGSIEQLFANLGRPQALAKVVGVR
ncbi:MAG: hypothetical protein MJK04_25550, partial [Psychrosphaera sp.]|nr:hypothetical protein [Psychrosphaera sp.]